jgi:hypothetical protein
LNTEPIKAVEDFIFNGLLLFFLGPAVSLSKGAPMEANGMPLARDVPLVPLSVDDCADNLNRAAINEANWIGKIVNPRRPPPRYRRATSGTEHKSFNPVFDQWIPIRRVLHPYPDARFAAIHPS